jgi:hypothetical protein
MRVSNSKLHAGHLKTRVDLSPTDSISVLHFGQYLGRPAIQKPIGKDSMAQTTATVPATVYTTEFSKARFFKIRATATAIKEDARHVMSMYDDIFSNQLRRREQDLRAALPAVP